MDEPRRPPNACWPLPSASARSAAAMVDMARSFVIRCLKGPAQRAIGVLRQGGGMAEATSQRSD